MAFDGKMVTEAAAGGLSGVSSQSGHRRAQRTHSRESFKSVIVGFAAQVGALDAKIDMVLRAIEALPSPHVVPHAQVVETSSVVASFAPLDSFLDCSSLSFRIG